MTTPAPAKLQPAIFGGLFIGVLSALPIVNLGNCCCLWVIGGGVLATYLMQQNHPFAVTAADGALAGLLAGLIGGIIGAILAVPIELMLGPMQQRLLERLLASNPDMPEETRRMFDNLATRGLGPFMFAVRLVFSVVIGMVFGMLGGLLGVAIFKKKDVPPTGTAEVLPPA